MLNRKIEKVLKKLPKPVHIVIDGVLHVSLICLIVAIIIGVMFNVTMAFVNYPIISTTIALLIISIIIGYTNYKEKNLED